MNYRPWNIDFSFCVGEYEDVELFRHDNHSVLLSRYVGVDKKEPENWFATVRVSKNGGDFGEPRSLPDHIAEKLVSHLESETA